MIEVRPLGKADYEGWRPLWDGYNAFYGRSGPTALPLDITETTWRRFFEPAEPVYALVAEEDGKLVGLTHYLYHRSTTRIELTCYLQDLFTEPSRRGRGIGKASRDVCSMTRWPGTRGLLSRARTFDAPPRLPGVLARVPVVSREHDGAPLSEGRPLL